MQHVLLLLPAMTLVAFCEAKSLLKGKACGVPEIPLNSAYRCEPSLCQDNSDMFKAGTILEFYCQPGYVLAQLPGISICHRGEWRIVQDVLCKLQSTPSAPPHSSYSPLFTIIPLIAAACIVLSALIFTVMLCVLLKPMSSRCGCARRVYNTLEEPDVVVAEDGDGSASHCREDPPAAALPSYEEAIYGQAGGPPLHHSQGFLPLVLSAQPGQSDDIRVEAAILDAVDPPPSYQEVMAEAGAEDAPEVGSSARWAIPALFPLER